MKQSRRRRTEKEKKGEERISRRERWSQLSSSRTWLNKRGKEELGQVELLAYTVAVLLVYELQVGMIKY